MARWLIYGGIGLVLLGALVWGIGRFIDIGHLPGDVSFEGKNVKVFVPITSMIIISIVLTVLLNLILRWWQ
ncbi:hypothetical protein CRI94_12250 [Longibacter salinarum]|uniref:DUF2905 domain-containing protein n=1 Tax=Longibacter salinarum TaxID=1850348 RepID=A0A2A8CW93_9BACT|nr:hypothetical protein CRI94_12250 [Longibacter salinarum]